MQRKARNEEFIICTENGVRYKLEKDNPDKKFYFTETEPVCDRYEADHIGKGPSRLKNRRE